MNLQYQEKFNLYEGKKKEKSNLYFSKIYIYIYLYLLKTERIYKLAIEKSNKILTNLSCKYNLPPSSHNILQTNKYIFYKKIGFENIICGYFAYSNSKFKY